MQVAHRQFGKLAFFLCMAAGVPAAWAAAPLLSERDYFDELPIVLSVSRLAQPLDETPAAVTVIDRDTLRRSGARDVYGALRLVPGFLVSGWNGASPVAAYHNVLDQFGAKLQVFIDGRSVYSTFYLGGTQRGLQDVILEDVERIEVLRGSNSAAYGANAFLGVINVVTRHAADTRGALVSLTKGEGGMDDNLARIGWGDDDASFRISAARRSDNGLDKVFDDSRIGQIHMRADLRPSERDEVMLQAGDAHLSWGDGEPGVVGNPTRSPAAHNAFLVGEWRRLLGEGEDLRLSFSHDIEGYRDRVPYGKTGALYDGVFLDSGGNARRTQVEAQHSFTPAAGWRAVWGGTFRDERAWSPALYYGQDWVSARQWRLFGNVEWRPHAKWLLNAGGMRESTSGLGGAWSPRLTANYHLLPGQTLRAGITRSQRAPTLFERHADVRYFNAANRLVGWTWNMRDKAKPENMLVKEVGYLGEFRPLGLSVDMRGYRETISDPVVTSAYFNGLLNVNEKITGDTTMTLRGFEYQLRWQPTASTRIWLNHMSTRALTSRLRGDPNVFSSPHRAESLNLFQSLPSDFDLTISYSQIGAMAWRALKDMLPDQHSVDVRLAKRFLVGTTRAEAAIVVQAAAGGYEQFVPGQYFGRRAFATLRLEY